MDNEELETNGNPNYYTVYRLPKKHTLKDIIEWTMKRIPKKVAWATLTLHIAPLEDYVIYDHSDKKILKDRRKSETVENLKDVEVVKIISNIDYNEHYYDIYFKEAIL